MVEVLNESRHHLTSCVDLVELDIEVGCQLLFLLYLDTDGRDGVEVEGKRAEFLLGVLRVDRCLLDELSHQCGASFTVRSRRTLAERAVELRERNPFGGVLLLSLLQLVQIAQFHLKTAL